MITDMSNSTQILQATLWGEAEGQSLAGKAAVASVILNRLDSWRRHKRRQFGTGTIASVCLAPWQFSCWNFSTLRRALLLSLDLNNPSPALADCILIAGQAIAGTLADSVRGLMFYKRFDAPWPSDWGLPEKPPVMQIEAHQFFDL